ncbi:sodium/glutamate symporter [Vibrio comitans]|uniref:Sodium/glutamate symporter n=1 Tax=Vibrio comitans NBRC 102076 TaxID=1219078 RepID=A0A4Y3ITQ9_9VIBR|nr:sodium/glutamate symporter [Vibrio comitans]GEA62294.1 glutamate permease [Vibrio comitans NBRC 102076]
MDIAGDQILIGSFLTFTLGIIVLFIGRRLTKAWAPLAHFNIPEPVSGGLLLSITIALIFFVTGKEISFDLVSRDVLLVYFFTTIGINASLQDLLKGGKPLLILLAITISYMFVQNYVGIGVASLFSLPEQVGLLGGSVSLIGGHGTAIAWAPRISESYGIANAMEIGIACATFGLILASLMGGPIAQFLIKRHKLSPSTNEPLDVGIKENNTDEPVTAMGFLDAVLAIHVCIILGAVLNESLEAVGLQLPLFVTCLFSGIIVTNLVPSSLPTVTGTKWPSRQPAVALISEIALGTFLAMSLMSMQLWTLIDLAGPIFAILGAQFIVAVLITLFVVFPSMGKNYDAAVICAGFGGISLGSTPTAMANMSAVASRYGNSHLAFVVVPLVCAFFIDLANALLIPWLLAGGWM